MIALDDLAPEESAPQLWCIRELLTGVVLRSGWLSRQDHAACEGLLRPLRAVPWPLRAVVSAPQRLASQRLAQQGLIVVLALRVTCSYRKTEELTTNWGEI